MKKIIKILSEDEIRELENSIKAIEKKFDLSFTTICKIVRQAKRRQKEEEIRERRIKRKRTQTQMEDKIKDKLPTNLQKNS